MPSFTALERLLERFFERPSARLFGTQLQPIQLLHRVERAMETGRRTTAEGVVVPGNVRVRLQPADLEAFGPAADALAGELADGALRFARAHGYRLLRRPVVELVADPTVEAGEPLVEASFGESGTSLEDGAPPRSGRASGPDDRTIAFAPPAPARPLARLRVLEPHGGDRMVLVGSTPLSIGRGMANDLTLGDARVSRQHARLQLRQGRLVLRDLDSRNGTWVNGVPVEEIVLGIGDEIVMGDTRLYVEEPPA